MSRPAACLALLLLSGCFGSTEIDPVYEIDSDSSLVVIPFKEPTFPDRWDSPAGHRLAEATTMVLSENADFEVRPYRKVIELFAAEKKDVRQLKPRDVAALTKADYVLVCDLSRWEPMEVKGVGITQANATATARLFKVERGKRASDAEEDERVREQNEARREIGLEPILVERGGDFVSKVEVSARYPDTFMGQEGETFLNQDEAETGLISALAREVAKLYYEHEEDFKKHKGR
jgi:hypothetical protein